MKSIKLSGAKILAFLLSVSMVMSLVPFCAAAYSAQISEAKLESETHEKGKNAITGAKEAYTWDNALATGVGCSANFATAQTVAEPLSNNTSNNVVQLTPSWTFPQLVFNFAQPLEEGEYTVSFDAYRTGAPEKYAQYFWVFAGYDTNNPLYTQNPFYADGKWQSFTYTLTLTEETNKFFIQFQANDAANERYFVDNFSIIPSHKITYLDNDGTTVIRTEYRKIDTDVFFPAVTDEDRQKDIIGWSAQNDRSADKSVPVTGNDITLYAIYKSCYDPGVNVITGDTSAYKSGKKLSDGVSVKALNAVIDLNAESPSGNGAVISLLPTWSYPQLKFTFTKPLPAGTYYFNADLYRTVPENKTPGQLLWVVDTENNNSELGARSDFEVSDDWKNYEIKFTLESETSGIALQMLSNHYSTSQEVFYADNVYLTPAYTVRYIDNDGVTVIRTDTVKVTDGIFVPEVSQSDAQRGICGWSAVNDGKVSQRIEVGFENFNLYAVYKPPFTPGTNILTGDESYVDFSDGKLPDYITTNEVSGLQIVDSPLQKESSNLVVQSGKGTKAQFPNVIFSLAGKSIPAGKYYVSFKAYKTCDASDYGYFWYLFRTTKQGQEYVDLSKWENFYPNSSGWYEYSGFIDSDDYMSDIFIQWNRRSSSDELAYFDNIYISPAFLVKYDDGNGNIIRSGYEGVAGHSFVPSLTPDDIKKGIIGWSCDNDGIADERIELDDRTEYTIYAVYDKGVHIKLNADKNMLTSAGQKAIVTAQVSRLGGLDGISFSFNILSGAEHISISSENQNEAVVTAISEGMACISLNASTGENALIYILCDFGSKNAVRIVQSTKEIDKDGENAYFKAEYFSDSGDKADIRWKISNVKAAGIVADGNYGAELIPVKNGIVTVTAYSVYDENISDSVEISISNQREKALSYDIKVLFWGASLLKHAPAPSLSWTGFWGMAASSEDKDYAHRYVQMLEDEFSPCDISYSMLVGPGLDLAISNDTDNTTDYTQLADYEKMKTRVAEFQPDVFSIGMTDNMSANHNPDAAFRAYTEYIDMVYEQKSDVIIIFHYDNMVHVASKEKLVEKLYEKYKDRGFLVYHPDLVHDEYMALEWLDRDPPQPGVAAHLNDKGMNEVAKNLFEYTKQPLYDKLVPNYIYLPKGISISGQNEITQLGGSVKFSVSAVPSDASKEVNWSVDNENIAVIDSKGTLTAKNNGKVTVRAESKYADGIYAVYTVSISGQPQSYTVTYNAGTLSDVTGLPENDEYVRGEYTVSDIVPLRDCYTFVGWSLSENSSETVKSVTVNSDITLYAVWKKTVGFEFEGNFDENAGFTYGFDIDGGFHASVSDSCLSVACTAGQKVRYKSPKLDIPKTEYVSFALMSEHFDTDTTVELTLFTDKDAYKYNFRLSTSDMTVYSAYIGDVDASTVTGFEIYVNSVTEDGSIFPVSLDYARFENMVFASSGNASHRLYVGNSKSVNVRFDFGNVQSGVVIAAGYTAQNCMEFADILLPDDIVLELNGNDVLAELRAYLLKSLETASPFARPICIEIDR